MESAEQVISQINEENLTPLELFEQFDIIVSSLFVGKELQPQRDAM